MDNFISSSLKRRSLLVALTAPFMLSQLCVADEFIADKASDNGVTWFFDKSYPVGRFADGSNYVVAPSGLSVTMITPEWDGKQHGTELNPAVRGSDVGTGWATDAEHFRYNSSLNVSERLPVVIVSGDMLVSARGNSVNASKGLPIHDLSILTVVDSHPPEGSFRPPLLGKDKRIRGTVRDLNYAAFPKLRDPGISTPAADFFVKAGGSRYFLDMANGWKNSGFKTQASLPNYGRDISNVTAKAALWLCLDLPDSTKAQVMVPLVQRGIDLYGLMETGFKFAPNGGHNCGRKIKLAVAAVALGDKQMMALLDGDRMGFQEDGQHDYVTQFDVDNVELGTEPFTMEMLLDWNGTGRAMPEWWSNAISLRERRLAGSEWARSYRGVTGVVSVGAALAAELIGVRKDWNDEAFFEYVEKRFWPIEERNRANAKNRIDLFPAAMWDSHKPDVKPVPPSAPTGLRVLR
jgi:hypothetical protein